MLRIRIEVSDGSLFDSSDSDALALIDQEESRKLYCQVLESTIKALYPQADVGVNMSDNDTVTIHGVDDTQAVEDEIFEAGGSVFNDWDSWIIYNQDAIESKYNCKFHWDAKKLIWCLTGTTDTGDYWETDDYDASSKREALADALEYLENYDDEDED